MTTMRNMITERHNKASRQIIKALKKGHYVANIRFTDIGSDAKLKEQGIDTTDTENRVLPAWMFPRLPDGADRTHFSRPDAILLTHNHFIYSVQCHKSQHPSFQCIESICTRL